MRQLFDGSVRPGNIALGKIAAQLTIVIAGYLFAAYFVKKTRFETEEEVRYGNQMGGSDPSYR